MTSTFPSSSFSCRYLPLRPTLLIFRPSSASVNFFFVPCRRMDRSPWTSTFLIFLPATSRSRSRRIVSTSGSSGIVLVSPHRGAVLVLLPTERPALEALPRDLRRSLLRLLLGAAFALAPLLAGDRHRRAEVLRVVGTGIGHRIHGQL